RGATRGSVNRPADRARPCPGAAGPGAGAGGGAMMGAARVTAAIVALAPAALAGPIETLVETGDVALAVRADRSSLTTAETLILRLEATVPAGARVQWPEFDERLGEFTIIDRLGLPPRRAADGRRRVVRTLTLSPFLPGEYEIPPLD